MFSARDIVWMAMKLSATEIYRDVQKLVSKIPKERTIDHVIYQKKEPA